MTYTLEQIKENRRKWVEALRSGKYKQGKAILFNGTTGKYCCLGVLCAVSGIHGDDIRGGTLAHQPGVMADVGLTDVEGIFAGGWLTRLNDSGVSFATIADLIESEPDGLFIPDERLRNA